MEYSQVPSWVFIYSHPAELPRDSFLVLSTISILRYPESPFTAPSSFPTITFVFPNAPHISSGIFFFNFKQYVKKNSFSPTCHPQPASYFLCSVPNNSIHIHSISIAKNSWVILRYFIPSPSTPQSSNPGNLTSEINSLSFILPIHSQCLDQSSHSFLAGPLQYLLFVLQVSLGSLLKKQPNQDILWLRNP